MDNKEPDSPHGSEGGLAVTGHSSPLTRHSEMAADIEEASVVDRSMVLRDFVIECSPKDAAYLSDELSLVIFGINEEQDNGRMEKISPTQWIYHRVIELKPNLDELMFIARSEDLGDFGYTVLPQDMLAALRTTGRSMTLCCNLETEETTSSPFLTMVCDVGFMDEWSTTISLARAKINNLTAGTEPYFDVLNMLSLALRYRFEKEGLQNDIDEAISLRRAALDRPPPHPDLYLSIDSLAVVLWIRFQHNRELCDLDESISLNKLALDLEIPPDSERDRAVSLDNLAASLIVRFEATGHQTDLDEAILFHRQAMELRAPPHPERCTSFHYLATALLRRFEQTGLASDLDEAVSFSRQALNDESLPDHLRFPCRNNVAIALHHRFKQGGLQDDLDEVISLHKKAVEQEPDWPASLVNLGSVLLTRFRQGGLVSDVNEAISSFRQALEMPPSRGLDRSLCLDNLACALVSRFENSSQQDDLDEAILLHRQGLNLRPTPHPYRSSSLSNLANTLRLQFAHRTHRAPRQISNLNESITLLREALVLRMPPHPLRSSSLNNLSLALQMRFEVEARRSDLDESISLLQEAVKLKSGLHFLRSSSLNNLGQLLFCRFELSSQESDLKESILLQRQALVIQPGSHPKRSLSLSSLAKVLIHAHSLLWTDEDYLDEAMFSFSAAIKCPSQPASFRLFIAKMWIDEAKRFCHASELEAYRAALEALPQLAALNIGIDLREEALRGRSHGLAQGAATCAIRSGDIGQAVELLEAGRTIFWSQILSLRSSFEELRDLKPELADKLQDIATALEYGAHRDTSVEISDNQRKLAIDLETSKLHQLQEDWTTGLDAARQLTGFEDFLRPRRLSSLQAAASQFPVVMLLENDDTSHCLILTSKIVHHIPLSHLPGRTLQNLVNLVQKAAYMPPTSRLFSETTRMEMEKLLEGRAIRPVTGNQLGSSDAIFRIILRVLWDDIVKPVIDFLQIQKSATPCVLQWCPTGLFSFLPIHAAGCYDKPSAECATDYFVSSYTPTVGTLLNQNSISTASVDGFKMMAVIQSQKLASTKEELEKIKRHVPSDSLITFGAAGVSADVESVASRLPDVSIVHFACHGRQDRAKPLKSGLELEDGILRVSRIMQEKVPNGSLAVLCACETAMGDQELPDEAMSIGASLLFSGFRRVVGTMWVMADTDGPAITDAFYEELFRGSDGKPGLEPDITQSAQALHVAVQKLRSKNVPFQRWVPFIHLGQ